MATLGVFRDDVYNFVNTLPGTKFTSTAQASGVLAASAVTGAQEVYVTVTTATALTTDTAANIIAAFLSSIQQSTVGVQPTASRVQGVSWTVALRNTGAGLTLTGGTGVTLLNGAAIATGTQELLLVTITSPTTVSIQFT